MIHLNKSICIVASTLPAGFIASKAFELGIFKIIVMSANLELSYQVFKEKNPNIKVICAPKGILQQAFFFIVQLFNARLRGNKIVFFHECCMPLLDLLLLVIKPQGYYFPQVTMAGFVGIEYDQFPKSKLLNIIKILGLKNKFKFYYLPKVGKNENEYIISVKKYPSSIISKSVAYSSEIKYKANEKYEEKENNVLFLTAKTFVLDEIQVRIYKHLMRIAHKKGYVCYIKDHPNPIYRLNIENETAINCDPFIPSELLVQNFHLVVGVASSGLMAYGPRALSFIDLIPEMNLSNRHMCKNHFETAFPNNQIKYIKNYDQFDELL